VVVSRSPSYQDQGVGWQYVAAANSTYLVGRVRQRTVALAIRADLAFSPHLILQLYAQPFVSLAQYKNYARLVDAHAAEPSARFSALAPSDIVSNGGMVSVRGEGLSPLTFPQPDGVQRTLVASAVLRWEFRPGSFLSAVWSHRGSHFRIGDSRFGPNLGQVLAEPGTDVFLLKANYLLAL